MAEVRMSLEEYDKMRRDLDAYERVLKKLFKIHINEYALNNFKETDVQKLYINNDCSNIKHDKEFQHIARFFMQSSLPVELLNLGKFEWEENFSLTLATITKVSKEDESNE